MSQYPLQPDDLPKVIREASLGDAHIRYLASHAGDAPPGLLLVPRSRAGTVVPPRPVLTGAAVTMLPHRWLPIRAWEIEPLAQVRRRGDAAPGGLCHARTSSGSPSTLALRWVAQTDHTRPADGAVVIRTELATSDGMVVEHSLCSPPDSRAIEVRTKITNRSTCSWVLDHLSSFALGGITPFAAEDAHERLVVHRFRTGWSGEGRSVAESIEQLHLERSWTGHAVQIERFGSIGSMPARGWFPVVVVEDKVAGVFWAATLEAAGSWQLELRRRADQLALCGGLADRDHGHWGKQLAPGETFEAPPAWIAVSTEGADDACARLHDPLRLARRKQPTVERDLPIVFNEWCTSWGNPTHENIIALADRLAGSGVRYLVIDDGWATRSADALLQENGDWIVDRGRFPEGMVATADAIRARGLIPGIWFEFEVVNAGTRAWDQTAHLLHRDGAPLQVGTRRFWDFRDPWVHDYLGERVLSFLRGNRLGYLKIDYNDSLGIGCDGAESLGEALRAHLEGALRFLNRLRHELPDLVIENCSSGGHRLSHAWMAPTAMSSVTDAHETPDIPIIAANLIPLVPAAQRQLWAVLRSTDSPARLSYSLAALFLGRACLSGEVHTLGTNAWAFVRRAIRCYRKVAGLIDTGIMTRHGSWGDSYQHPTGAQAVLCIDSPTGAGEAFVVWHAFDAPPPALEVALVPARPAWHVDDEFSDRPAEVELEPTRLTILKPRAWSGGVIFLRR